MMHPSIETMISDITKWIGDEYCLRIWFDVDDGVYEVSVKYRSWRFAELEECISGAWEYLDTHREEK